MNILVCISRVPDTAAKIMPGSDGISIDPKGVKFILNPYDEFAIEEGLQQKQKHGGTVTALTVGTEEAKDILRTALAMGADSAVLIKGEMAGKDLNHVAQNIAQYAKDKNYDLVICGRQSIDNDSFQVPSMVAELLGIPSVSVVSKLDIDGGTLIAERDIEGGKEMVEAQLPCLVSAQKGLNEPRYPKLPDIMKAKRKPIDEVDASDFDVLTSIMSMELPKKERVGKIVSDSDSDIAEIVKALHEDAKVI